MLEGPGSGRSNGAGMTFTRTWDGNNKDEIGYVLYTHEIHSNAVHMGIRVYSAKQWLDSESRKTAIRNAPEREFWYKPGETTQIPIEGMGQIILKGNVTDERPILRTQEAPHELSSNQIMLSFPALVRNNQLLFQLGRGNRVGYINCSASGHNAKSAVSVYFPEIGVFVLAVRPFDGAVEGRSYGSQAGFTLHGEEYRIYSATPITTNTGQPSRPIWVCYDPHYRPSLANPDYVTKSEDDRLVISCGDVENLLKDLHRR